MLARPYPKLSDKNLVAFESKVIRTDGCHWWTGYISTTNRYGYFSRYLVHRLAYVQKHGDIGAGMVIDHLCRNRECVNPDHLEAVTPRENILRGDSAKKKEPATHCRRGHPLVGEHLYQNPHSGRRACRTCLKLSYSRRRVKRGGRMGPISINISPGELVDRISIVEIKLSRLTDPEKVTKVHGECMELRRTWEDSGIPYGHLGPDIMRLWRELHDINLKGWQLEDKVRQLESIGDFGTMYIESCRAIHRNNDQRSATKRAINDLAGSEAVEEKIHGGA